MPARIGPKQLRRNYLRQWREKRALTQEQLAERLGTTKGQVSNWERAIRAMTYNVQAALAEALSIEPGDLFRDPERPSVDELLRGQPPAIVEQALAVVQALIRKAS